MTKTIFITGAARGIGKDTAALFASKGWVVGISDLDQQLLNEVKTPLGKNVHAFVGDVSNDDSIKMALAQFADISGGSIDVLVNNAGILKVGEFDELSMEDHQRIIDINVNGLLRTSYHALPYLKKAGKSHIINLCSASAIYGQPELTAYAASKAAVKSITEGLNVSLEKHGITVCDLMPMYVKTRMVTENYGRMGLYKESLVKLTTKMIADIIWKAAHSQRIHWVVGKDAKVFYFLSGFIPPRLVKVIMKKLIRYE